MSSNVVSIRLDDATLDALEAVAAEANVKRGWLMREILRYTMTGRPLPALFVPADLRPGETAQVTTAPVAQVQEIRATRLDAKGRPARPMPKGESAR